MSNTILPSLLSSCFLKKSCFAFLIGSFFCANPIHAQPIEKIYLNPKNPTVQKQSSYIDSLVFLSMETKEGINFNEFANVRLTNDYFLVTDNAAGYLYLYSKTGAFVKQINYKSVISNIPPSYHAKSNEIVFFGNNSNYTLTSKDKVKIQLDWSNPRNLKYFKKYVINLSDTAFVIKEAKPTNYDLIGAYSFYANQYIQPKINTSPLYKDSIGYELSVYEHEKLIRQYFPYNRVNEPKFLFSDESLSVVGSDKPNIYYLMRPYSDTIYQSVNGGITPVYQLVMPLENSLPANFFTEKAPSKAVKENFKRNNGWLFHQVVDFYETAKLIYITIRFFSHYEVMVYDKQTRTAYNATKIKADPSQYNLTLLSQYNMVRSGQRFYKLIKVDLIASFLKLHPEISIPEALAATLQGNTDKNKLLIVSFKLKD